MVRILKKFQLKKFESEKSEYIIGKDSLPGFMTVFVSDDPQIVKSLTVKQLFKETTAGFTSDLLREMYSLF